MRKLLIPLLAAIALPTAVSADTIPKISDFDLLSKEGEKFDFECPYEECWFQLNPDHINIMDMQKIRRKDIIDVFSYEINHINYVRYVFLYKLNGDIKRMVIQPPKRRLVEKNFNQSLKMTEAITLWLNK